MSSKDDAAFELSRFLPYLLNQAAERVGKDFEAIYRDRYGLTRTQWRILAHLGAHGRMTAANVSRRTQTEKSKISRALMALDERGLVSRAQAEGDRRLELLELTPQGSALHADMAREAIAFDDAMRQRIGSAMSGKLERILLELTSLNP